MTHGEELNTKESNTIDLKDNENLAAPTNNNNNNESSTNKVSKFFLYSIMLFMVITGSANTIFTKMQNVTKSLNRDYLHPWFQTQNMFLGEFYCFIAWSIYKYYKKVEIQEEKEKDLVTNDDGTKSMKPDPSPFLFMIPCSCDIIGTTLLNFALIMMSSSIFQMFRGGLIIITAFLSCCFLKKRQYIHHYLGIGLTVLALFLVGLGDLLHKQSDDQPIGKLILGMCLMIVSLFFTGFQFVFEEKIVDKYYCHPLQVVAWEGIWGSIFFIIALPIFQVIKCPLFKGVNDICSIDQYDDNLYFIENTLFAFKQMAGAPILFFFIIGSTISIGSYNYFGITLTKYISSPARAVLDNTRTVVVWLWFLLLPVPLAAKEDFIWLQLVGFIVLIVGNVIYNEIVTLPFLGLDFNTKDKIEKRKLEEESGTNEKFL